MELKKEDIRKRINKKDEMEQVKIKGTEDDNKDRISQER